jgi:hypothetical protein
MGVVEKNPLASDNDWEKITSGGDVAIKKRIADQMSDRTCAVILIGANTAGRKWINYEIVKAWNDGKGLFGIHIHNLKNRQGMQSSKGLNPFDTITLGSGTKRLSNIVAAYDPPYSESTMVYRWIGENLDKWVESAIRARKS